MKSEWEQITESTARMNVINGWLVYNRTVVGTNRELIYNRTVIGTNREIKLLSESMVFVPDPNHEWKVEKCEK
jgi:hypothetical protein